MSEVEGSLNEAQARRSELEAETARLSKDLDGHVAQKTDLEATVADLKSKLSSADTEKADLTQKLEAAESALNAKVRTGARLCMLFTL